MDEAAVHTIDAWCQRVLREHAFDSGSLFDEELQANEAALHEQAVRDYWRQQVYPLPEPRLAQVLARWKDVDALHRALQDLRDKPVAPSHGEGALGERLDSLGTERAETLAALKQGWAEGVDAMRQWFEHVWSAPADTRKGLPTRAHATRWLDALAKWAQDPGIDTPDVKTGADKLRASALRQTLAALGRPATDVPEVFDRFEALMQALPRLPEPATAMRLHAAASVQARAQALKARAGTFGFADALRRLYRRWTRPPMASARSACARASSSVSRWRWSTNSRTPRRCSCASSTASTASPKTTRNARCC